MKIKLSKSARKLLAVSLVLTLLITFAVPWLTEGRTGGSSSYLSLAFEGIGEGLDSKGNHFDINEIKSDEVLNNAIKAAGMKGKYTPQQLRQMVVIKPLAGKNALDELTKLTTTSKKTESVAEKSVNTGDYQITVKEIGILPNPLDNLKLSKSLMKEYRNYLKTSYLKDSSISSAYKKEDIFSLDYPEMMLVMQQDADALVRYVSTFAKNSPGFISEKTGVTFADVQSQAEAVRDKEIGNTADIVDYYVLSKNSDRTAYENVKLKRANLVLNKNQGIESGIGYILASYDNTSNYMLASEDAQNIQGGQENMFYGNLMNQLVNSKNATINAKYNLAEIQKHIDKLSGGQGSSELAKSVDKDAKAAYARMEQLRKQVKTLAEENYDLNIGSKIDISKASYGVNSLGNILVNFVMILVLLGILRGLFVFYQTRGKAYLKQEIERCIGYGFEKIGSIQKTKDTE